MAITSKVQRLAVIVGTGAAAALYTCPASSRVISPILYVNTIGVADTPVFRKTWAAIPGAAVTIRQIAKRALAIDDDAQIELAGLEAGDVVDFNGLTTTIAELWGVLDA